ncbi:MAG TPA: hypothetical protein VL021_05885 [Brumimicrobium sp.]|nr:hypothetical protein [Brumimicrobium sp.]
MRFSSTSILLFFSIFIAHFLQAQEGGPPMLTDDAQVADFKEWELNTSFNTSLKGYWELSTPHIDLNYGLFHNVQLKIEAPLLLGFPEKGRVDVGIGEIIGGIKWRFLDEDLHFVSAATFPQYTFNETKGFYLPVFFEKTVGNFLGGIAVAYFFGESQHNHSEVGALFGYTPTDNLSLMLEYYSYQNYHEIRGMNGYVNTGFRYLFSDNFMLMGSFGTQVNGPTGEVKERFISWIGIKNLF